MVGSQTVLFILDEAAAAIGGWTALQSPAILGFTETRNANPRLHPAIGLYHFALRFPTRREAQAFLRVVAADYPIDGTSDHGMHESIYLSDPDGNGMELTAAQRSLTSNRLKKRNPSEGA